MKPIAYLTWRAGLGTYAALTTNRRWIGDKPAEFLTVPSLLRELESRSLAPDVEDITPQPENQHDVTLDVDLNTQTLTATGPDNTETIHPIRQATKKAVADALLDAVGIDDNNSLRRNIPELEHAIWRTTARRVLAAIDTREALDFETSEPATPSPPEQTAKP